MTALRRPGILYVVSLVGVQLWYAQQALIPLCQLFACGACLHKYMVGRVWYSMHVKVHNSGGPSVLHIRPGLM